MTREEIIVILESYKSFEDNRTEDLLHHGYDNTKASRKRKEALDEAIKALSENKGEWIPVKKGMKIPDHEVLCCDKYGEELLGYLYFDEESDQIVCDSDPMCMYDVVAYMEKPKPYKKGGAE